MNAKSLIPQPSAAIPILALVFSLHLYTSNLPGENNNVMQIPASALAPTAARHAQWQTVSQASIAAQLRQLEIENQAREQQIKALLQEHQFKQARTLLLETAAQAVAQVDQNKLANVMLLLGAVAIDEMELDSAEVYLLEALDIALQLDDKKAVAASYRQLARLHIRSRALARIASNSYDDLWVARTQINLGEYREAEHSLQQVIETNIAIKRFGAAASAYKTLAEFHLRFHDDYLAQQAAFEAARLYASSGQLAQAYEAIATLRPASVDAYELERLGDEINTLLRQHQDDIEQTAQARDFEMLYYHYQTRGEEERAWKLRVLASEALAKTSARSMYQRQADVMAVLYNSNFAMAKAREYLGQASSLFAEQGEQALYQNTERMFSLVY